MEAGGGERDGFDLRQENRGRLQREQQEAIPRRNRAPLMERNPKLCICGTLCGSIVALVLVLISLATVDPTEYGLRYNRFTKTVNEHHVYRGGRHFIGPLSSMLTFPATVQNLEFSERPTRKAPPLSTRTAEGLALTLHVSFQYELMQSDVPKLYALANVGYAALYMKVARDVLLKAAAKYVAPQYWTERELIGKEMQRLVNVSLLDSYARCTGLQLMIIDLPDQYEASIVETQVQKQKVRTKENEQLAALIRAQIGVMVAGFQNNITVTLNGAHASAELATKSAEARAQQMKIKAEDKALEQVIALLNITPAGLVSYQRGLAYQSIPNASFVFGVNSVTVWSNGPSPQAPAPSYPMEVCQHQKM